MRKFAIVSSCLALAVCLAGVYIGYQLRTFGGEASNDAARKAAAALLQAGGPSPGLSPGPSSSSNASQSTGSSASPRPAAGSSAPPTFAPRGSSAPVYENDGGDIAARDAKTPKIGADTVIVYEYADAAGGTVDRSEELAPYYMFGKTEADLLEQFKDWYVTEFSAAKVVMRRETRPETQTGGDADAQNYVVGLKDGFVAVFYQTPVNGDNLKEVTDMPASALPESEQNRLELGIDVIGEAQLARIMEDYGS